MRTFTMIGNWTQTPLLERFASGMRNKMEENGYRFEAEPKSDIQLVFNFVDPQQPQYFRRNGKGTFVLTIAESNLTTDNILYTAYPILVRSLGNMMIYIDRSSVPHHTYFITLEQGCYPTSSNEADPNYFDEVFSRIEPLATAQLVIDNKFIADLPQDLWSGDHITQSLHNAGKMLDQMNLLPTPFPIDQLLSPKELRHIKRLYGIGGLSYGNLSARKEGNHFWMSASGVNKSSLKEIGRDILYIRGFNEKDLAMEISIPPHVSPRRASVDAIEHWMIYNEHPEVGAIVHIHAWMDGVPSTEINYPCGTVQLAEAVAEQIRKAEDPSRAVVGLKNHGLTITGRNLEDIFERIEGRILPQVPMS
ncbi:class II aldolase/adducin family protein [Thermoflavimicrobium dichotomicum]|uniref:Ribulose-5-phosphate 4-epimerase/Fuculose-1-phosphate aldolase n=1 Tax=Thermoflavimicrobium dichotomicum TaxID=46223 RepID=A0A1I3PS46_9BACL|nr:class II aldolase/adducin family protein [Thermoflavimicrobium dichotomicum]SFJ24200.1 Ribulose-5-phosphate 4-epimerase/Fuculose-1-phosphate aldolase [Thermoflavimicrobium dichotomicum]